MKKHLIVLGIAVLLIGVGLSGCNEFNTDNSNGNGNTPSEYDRLVGSWYEGNLLGTITLFSDGDCSYGGLGGYWELKDGKLVFNLNQDGFIFTYDYYFSEDYNRLYITPIGTFNTYELVKQ